jgi:hypothetical protein
MDIMDRILVFNKKIDEMHFMAFLETRLNPGTRDVEGL